MPPCQHDGTVPSPYHPYTVQPGASKAFLEADETARKDLPKLSVRIPDDLDRVLDLVIARTRASKQQLVLDAVVAAAAKHAPEELAKIQPPP
jgi:hypothetical protein